MPEKKKILILIDWFLPGNKAGGPVKSVSSIVNLLHNEFDFHIITSNKDFGNKTAYEGIASNQWLNYKDKARVYYLSDNTTISSVFLKAIKDIQPQVIYINSYLSRYFSIIPLQLIKKNKIEIRTILAPRGMLSPGALKIKPLKKKLFILYAKATGLHKNILWHSTKTDETSDILANYPEAKIIEAQNISDVSILQPDPGKVKTPGSIKLVYLGRIAENKNLRLVLDALADIRNDEVEFDIYGSMEDPLYWEECAKRIEKLPKNIQVNYKGVLQPEFVQTTLRRYHFLIQLSYSENYGHSIVEALSCGLPVIISNTTPWQHLAKHQTGWDIDIRTKEPTVEALKKAIALNQEEYNLYCVQACKYAASHCINMEIVSQLKQLFNS